MKSDMIDVKRKRELFRLLRKNIQRNFNGSYYRYYRTATEWQDDIV